MPKVDFNKIVNRTKPDEESVTAKNPYWQLADFHVDCARRHFEHVRQCERIRYHLADAAVHLGLALKMTAACCDDALEKRMSDFDQTLLDRLSPLRQALCDVAATLDRGRAKHDDDGYHQSADFHITRARRHLELLAQDDRTEPHLAHAATRLLMALGKSIAE